MRSYEAARSTFSFLGFCAWALIVVGGIAALMGMAVASEMRGYGGGPPAMAILAATIPGAGIALVGMICLILVQMGRATVDTAEYTQQMLQLSRDQLEVSKQSLKAGHIAPQSFAAAALNGSPESPKASFATQLEKQTSSEPASNARELSAIPEGATVYNGKAITSDNGKFLYNGIPFDTLVAAQSYIDNIGASTGEALPQSQAKS